jgi:hypothetical protein
MTLTLTCRRCRTVLTADSGDELVALGEDHARQHGHAGPASRDRVLARIRHHNRPAEGSAAASSAPVKTGNSATKPENPGGPSEAKAGCSVDDGDHRDEQRCSAVTGLGGEVLVVDGGQADHVRDRAGALKPVGGLLH